LIACFSGTYFAAASEWEKLQSGAHASQALLEDTDAQALHCLQYQRRALAYAKSERRAVIVDTDVDIDDMMAIIYLLNDPSVDVKAITVETDGWSMQHAGLGNVMRLTQQYGCYDIPVAFGEAYLVTQLNGEWGAHPNRLPKISYLNGTTTFLTNWVPTPFNPKPPSSMSASELILHTFRESQGGVDLLALGPFTNIAYALHLDRDLFLSKMGTVYISGGKFNHADTLPKMTLKHGNAIEAAQAKTGNRGPGFPYRSPPNGANWNVFLDPISASQVISSGVSMVFMADNAEDMIAVNITDDKYIPDDCPIKQREYLTQFYLEFGPACDESMSSVRYWDPSAAVLMTQLMPTFGKGNASVCTDFRMMNLSVSLETGDHYSWTEQQPFGAAARVCLAANVTEFKMAYYDGSCRCPHGCNWSAAI